MEILGSILKAVGVIPDDTPTRALPVASERPPRIPPLPGTASPSPAEEGGSAALSAPGSLPATELELERARMGAASGAPVAAGVRARPARVRPADGADDETPDAAGSPALAGGLDLRRAREGIILAEVLGAPRSRSRFNNAKGRITR